MKLSAFFSLTLFSFSLYGAMGSSVNIPIQEHLKYSFDNQRNAPYKNMEKNQYYKSMAIMKEVDIRMHLSNDGYNVHNIKLRDIARELVYQVYVTDNSAKDLKLFVDPSNGSILKMEPIQ